MMCFPMGMVGIAEAGKITTFKLLPVDVGKPLTLDRILIVAPHTEEWADLLVPDVSWGPQDMPDFDAERDELGFRPPLSGAERVAAGIPKEVKNLQSYLAVRPMPAFMLSPDALDNVLRLAVPTHLRQLSSGEMIRIGLWNRGKCDVQVNICAILQVGS